MSKSGEYMQVILYNLYAGVSPYPLRQSCIILSDLLSALLLCVLKVLPSIRLEV